MEEKTEITEMKPVLTPTGRGSMYDIPKIWVSQTTGDYSVKPTQRLRTRIISEFIAGASRLTDLSVLTHILGMCKIGFEKILEKKDYEIKLDSEVLFEEMKRAVDNYIEFDSWRKALGGSPSISALAEMHLHLDELVGISDAYYDGNMVQTAKEIIMHEYDSHVNVQDRFLDNAHTNDRPATISLEDVCGSSKLMVSYNPGRKLKDLKEKEFYDRINKIHHKRKADTAQSNPKMIVALGGMNKGTPEEYKNMIDKIMSSHGGARIFVGTNSFKDEENEGGKCYKHVLCEANAVSFNENEIRSVYHDLGGDRTEDLADIVQKFHIQAESNGYIPKTGQIIICHTEGGAIAYRKPIEDGDENENDCDKQKKMFEEALEMAVGGASFRYMNGRFGSSEEIIDFSKTTCRAYDKFSHLFGRSINELPEGMCGAVSYDLTKPGTPIPQGSITGAGATFDGILVSYLAPLI
ncbi:hypothetical protein JW711_04890 [Candidatus Woesearchaeota archaeon]|nr:hypothetical protein [Candidatus Woesearchaeota archaeon]